MPLYPTRGVPEGPGRLWRGGRDPAQRLRACILCVGLDLALGTAWARGARGPGCQSCGCTSLGRTDLARTQPDSVLFSTKGGCGLWWSCLPEMPWQANTGASEQPAVPFRAGPFFCPRLGVVLALRGVGRQGSWLPCCGHGITPTWGCKGREQLQHRPLGVTLPQAPRLRSESGVGQHCSGGAGLGHKPPGSSLHAL